LKLQFSYSDDALTILLYESGCSEQWITTLSSLSLLIILYSVFVDSDLTEGYILWVASLFESVKVAFIFLYILLINIFKIYLFI